MARHESTSLKVSAREPGGSRTARRLRRAGNVPGVVYGGDAEPLAFQVSARLLRNTLAGAGAVLDLDVEGAGATPVMVKDIVRHPVTGATVHVDLLRVRLDQKIQSTLALELIGAEEAPGVREGGVLEHVTRELTIEALPSDIPDSLTHDVSAMQIGETLTLDALRPPPAVELIGDPETVIATLTPPRLQVESGDEIEQETQVVGEAGAEGSGAAEDSGGDADSDAE
ncbi:MAG: 50S ribosomal protein L25 [Solirubrobacteraceae bacterium]|jgi:large subunit ribosomal protein L25